MSIIKLEDLTKGGIKMRYLILVLFVMLSGCVAPRGGFVMPYIRPLPQPVYIQPYQTPVYRQTINPVNRYYQPSYQPKTHQIYNSNGTFSTIYSY